jgi:hypothetical protein
MPTLTTVPLPPMMALLPPTMAPPPPTMAPPPPTMALTVTTPAFGQLLYQGPAFGDDDNLETDLDALRPWVPPPQRMVPATTGPPTMGLATTGLATMGPATMGPAMMGPPTMGTAMMGPATMGPATMGPPGTPGSPAQRTHFKPTRSSTLSRRASDDLEITSDLSLIDHHLPDISQSNATSSPVKRTKSQVSRKNKGRKRASLDTSAAAYNKTYRQLKVILKFF